MAVILVTGGRNFEDAARANRVLNEIHVATPITKLIEGGARGADTLARNWAQANEIPVVTHQAEWDRYQAHAGRIRNIRMLAAHLHEIDLVVVFPGGRGTTHMALSASHAGLKLHHG